MKSSRSSKRWGQMTAAELAEATREFDQPLPASQYRSLTAAERKRFDRARRAGGLGVAIDPSELDPKLLKAARAYAKRKRLTMVQLLERGLRRELAVSD